MHWTGIQFNDRSVDESPNNEFLTCLPKHIMDDCPDDVKEIAQMHASEERQELFVNFAKAVQGGVRPRSFQDTAAIEEGLAGWGKLTLHLY